MKARRCRRRANRLTAGPDAQLTPAAAVHSRTSYSKATPRVWADQLDLISSEARCGLAFNCSGQLPAATDEATAGSTPTTIERDSSGCIRVTALTRKRASAAAAARKTSPRSSTPLNGLDEILKTLVFGRLILNGGFRVVFPSNAVPRESCFREGCCALCERRRSHCE
jgi:hypothetical protein